MLAKFLFRVFMDRDRAEVHKHAKIERDQYPATFTEQAWSKKDILYELTNTEKKNCACLFASTEREAKELFCFRCFHPPGAYAFLVFIDNI